MVRTAQGQLVPRRALTAIVSGSDFPVVWVCRDEVWREGMGVQDEGAVPWPADAVLAVP